MSCTNSKLWKHFFSLLFIQFTAKEIMEEWGDNGAIRPEHLREAHRRYKIDKVSSTSLGRRL